MNLSLGLRGWNSNPSITTTALPGRDRARRYFRIASSPAPGAFRTPARDNIRHKRVGPIPTASVQRYESYSYDDVGLSSIVDDSSPRPPSPETTSGSRGTRCSRFAFMRMAEIVHTAPAASISSHVASRTSPDRAAVRTSNSNASLTAGAADADTRTVSTAAATSLWGSASRCVTMSFCGPSTGSTRSHGLSMYEVRRCSVWSVESLK